MTAAARMTDDDLLEALAQIMFETDVPIQASIANAEELARLVVALKTEMIRKKPDCSDGAVAVMLLCGLNWIDGDVRITRPAKKMLRRAGVFDSPAYLPEPH